MNITEIKTEMKELNSELKYLEAKTVRIKDQLGALDVKLVNEVCNNMVSQEMDILVAENYLLSIDPDFVIDYSLIDAITEHILNCRIILRAICKDIDLPNKY